MKISEIAEILNAEVCCAAEHADAEVFSAFASDMMSDVLAYVKEQSILISGLCNPQTIRTAVMLDMKCVVLVRGKTPTADMLSLAVRNNIVVLATKNKMYPTCGILYEKGIIAGEYSL